MKFIRNEDRLELVIKVGDWVKVSDKWDKQVKNSNKWARQVKIWLNEEEKLNEMSFNST